MVPGIEHRRLRVRDGLEIAYQVRGRGPAIVLSNGLGGTYEAFRYLYEAFGEAYRTICWDYRGLYRSGRPADRSTLAVPHHCRDLVEILDREEIERAIFVGWSMGVQVNFELFREHAERVAGVVAINGTYGTPFRTALASRLSRYVIPLALSVMKSRASWITRGAHVAVGWSGMIPAMKRVGLVSERIDADAMMDVAHDFKTIDWSIYSDLLRRLGEHDARDLLPAIDVPVLIVTGDRDLFTPVFTAQRMNRRIRGSRLVVIEEGTHYTPLEFPDRIQAEVVRFLGGIDGWRPGPR
jgi:pimeloyl-ACP methyl ester carboxylesterase